MIFLSYLSMLYIRIDVRHLCLAKIAKFCDRYANVENVEEMVGTREAAAVATESGEAVATEFGGPATGRWRRLVTRRRRPVV